MRDRARALGFGGISDDRSRANSSRSPLDARVAGHGAPVDRRAVPDDDDDEETLDGRLLDESLYELTIEPARSVRRVAAIEDMPLIGYERGDADATSRCPPDLVERLREESRRPDGAPPIPAPISEVRTVPASRQPPPIPGATRQPPPIPGAAAHSSARRRWISRLLGDAPIRRG